MDKLDLIFDLQNNFDQDVIHNRKLENVSAEEWLQKKTLAMISELSEVIDEVNFKWWKNPKEVSMDSVKEELVDVLHFFVSMCLNAGMSSSELFERYKHKNQENFDRQYGKSLKKGYDIHDKH